MSNRTLVELNHDYCPNEMQEKDWATQMGEYMRSGDKDFLPKGVTFVQMHHHSEPSKIEYLQQQLDTANRRIAELESFQFNYEHAVNIEREDHQAEMEAAERKLATAMNWAEEQQPRLVRGRELENLARIYYSSHQGGSDPSRDDCRCSACIKYRALAQIEQPYLTESDKSDIAALGEAGYTFHEIASLRMLSWVDEPDVAPFVQDFKFRKRIYGLGHELIATALAQIELPQEAYIPDTNSHALENTVRNIGKPPQSTL